MPGFVGQVGEEETVQVQRVGGTVEQFKVFRLVRQAVVGIGQGFV